MVVKDGKRTHLIEAEFLLGRDDPIMAKRGWGSHEFKTYLRITFPLPFPVRKVRGIFSKLQDQFKNNIGTNIEEQIDLKLKYEQKHADLLRLYDMTGKDTYLKKVFALVREYDQELSKLREKSLSVKLVSKKSHNEKSGPSLKTRKLRSTKRASIREQLSDQRQINRVRPFSLNRRERHEFVAELEKTPTQTVRYIDRRKD